MPRRRRAIVVVGLLLSAFLAALEATVVSTAMPTVIADLGGIEHYSWVFTAYLLASTVTVPIYGKLADLYGRKPVLVFGLVLFLVGSLASGASTTMTQLIVFRALQGLGAGAMQPVTLTILGDLFTLEERARVQGLFGAVWGVAGLIGPLTGGFIVASLDWRWIFWLNLPFGLLALAIVALALHEQIEKKRHTLDLGGAALLTLGVLGLLSSSLPGILVAIALLGGFLWVETRVPEPILSLALFRERVFWVSSAANALIGAAMFASLTYVPLYVQGVLGGTPTEAGATITPMVVGWPVASFLTGRLLPKLGFRPFIRLGLFISAASALALAIFLQGDRRIVAQVAMFAFGIGMGFANTALLLGVQVSVDWSQRGVVTAATMFFRTIGGTLAVGAMGGWLALRLGPRAAEVNEILGGHGTISPEVVGPLEGGLHLIFWGFAAFAVAAALIGLWYPKQPTS